MFRHTGDILLETISEKICTTDIFSKIIINYEECKKCGMVDTISYDNKFKQQYDINDISQVRQQRCMSLLKCYLNANNIINI